jgi:hypothetical protein
MNKCSVNFKIGICFLPLPILYANADHSKTLTSVNLVSLNHLLVKYEKSGTPPEPFEIF